MKMIGGRFLGEGELRERGVEGSFSLWAFVVIAALAIGVRILLSLVLDWRVDFATGDSGWYLDPTSTNFRAPGYTAFLHFVGPANVLIIQAALGIVSGGAVWLALRPDNPRLAAVAGSLVALSPLPVPIELRILSETLYAFLVLCALLCLFRRPQALGAMIAGIFMGLALLTRDSLLLLPLFALPFLSWKNGAVFALTTAAVALPWYATHPGEGRAGFAIWIGTWERSPDWQAEGRFPEYAFTSRDQRDRLTKAFQRGDYAPFMAAARARMVADPAFVLSSWTQRYPRLWLSSRTELNTVKTARVPLKVGGHLLNLIVLVTGFFGAILTSPRFRIFWAPILYGAISFIPVHNTEPRYILFTLPFFMIFAAQISLKWTTKWKSNTSSTAC